MKLEKNNTYLVWEYEPGEWLEMKYVGFNKLQNEHIFVSIKDHEVFMYISEEDVESEVK